MNSFYNKNHLVFVYLAAAVFSTSFSLQAMKPDLPEKPEEATTPISGSRKFAEEMECFLVGRGIVIAETDDQEFMPEILITEKDMPLLYAAFKEIATGQELKDKRFGFSAVPPLYLVFHNNNVSIPHEKKHAIFLSYTMMHSLDDVSIEYSLWGKLVDLQQQINEALEQEYFDRVNFTSMPQSRKIRNEFEQFLKSKEAKEAVETFLNNKQKANTRLIYRPSKESMPFLYAAIEELARKWELKKIPTLKIPCICSVFAELDGIEYCINVGDVDICYFPDEEIISSISHEFAHIKKGHCHLLYVPAALSLVLCPIFLSYLGINPVNNLLSRDISGLCISGVIEIIFYYCMVRVVTPLWLFRQPLEKEADILGVLIDKNAKSSISHFIRGYVDQNSLKLQNSIEQNLETIEKHEASKREHYSIKQFIAKFRMHPTDYDRIHYLLDLEKQISTNNKTTETLEYEKYAFIPKWPEWKMKAKEYVESKSNSLKAMGFMFTFVFLAWTINIIFATQ